jgi:TldD protein
VANEKYWAMYGTPNCGKGEPGQVAHVGHGSAHARFRNVKVGVADVK